MLKLEYKDYLLQFKFAAGTSRGILHKHPAKIIRIYDTKNPVVYGLGEAAPLERLSPENFEDLDETLHKASEAFLSLSSVPDMEEVSNFVDSVVSAGFPSVKFALETALFDLINGGKRLIFDNEFARGKRFIPINGLVWMGDFDFMKKQVDEKLHKGFKCIKVKIGAIDFEEELKIIDYLRSQASTLTIRVDANGAFPNNEVLKKLNQLEEFNIHSIEQPIMPRQWEAMQLVCSRSPVPVALDEELIGITEFSQKQELLKYLKPAYIILKPTLLGGFKATEEWIRLANQLGIGWWVTSALESNVGLNAIAQFTARFENLTHQGLGTGQLYANNFESPLEINGEFLSYNLKRVWAISLF